MSGRFRILAAAAVISLAPTLSACVYAQHGGYRDNDRYGRASSYAFDTGYRDGWQRGERDARQRRAFDFRNEREYQRADRGYNWRYGSRDAYRYEFRRGYEVGYRDGYNSLGRRGYGVTGPGRVYQGRSPGAGYYRSAAAEHGSRDGYEKGVEDGRRGRRHDPVGQRWYRDGDRHYNSRYGSRDQWKDEYRRAFRDGYERGYRERR